MWDLFEWKDFSRNRCHPRPEVGLAVVGGMVDVGGPPSGEADRVLRRVERNRIDLTRAIPMVEIENLPPTM
jgi:hypothetical protein